MFHDSHNLNRIVADLLDARQDIVGERPVSVDLAFGRTGGGGGKIVEKLVDLELQKTPLFNGTQDKIIARLNG